MVGVRAQLSLFEVVLTLIRVLSGTNTSPRLSLERTLRGTGACEFSVLFLFNSNSCYAKTEQYYSDSDEFKATISG